MIKGKLRHIAVHTLRKTIILSKPYLVKSALIKNNINRLLNLSPKLKARLLRLGVIEQPLISVNNIEELSPHAKEYYWKLKKRLGNDESVTL